MQDFFNIDDLYPYHYLDPFTRIPYNKHMEACFRSQGNLRVDITVVPA